MHTPISQTRDGRNSTDYGSQNQAIRPPHSWCEFLFAPSSDGLADPLLDIVRRDHTAAMIFLRAVMLVSGLLGAIVVLGTGIVLSTCWHCFAVLDRPLHWWLLINALLQVVQVPVRLVFHKRLVAEREPVDFLRMQVLVSTFTSTPAWRASKHCLLFSYAWFILGFVWVMKAGNCSASPGIYRFVVAIIVQAMLRAILALVAFRALFAHTDDDPIPRMKAATAQQVAALPSMCFRHGLFQDEESPSCAVCLAEYSKGEWLLSLPCNHHFHRHCGEKWLMKSKTCPLCIRPIDFENASNCRV